MSRDRTLLVFAVALALLAPAVFAGEGFAEPDSYYHLRFADLWARGEIPEGSFPWASASTWATAFADKDWLFHVALVPFVRAFPANEVFGGKVATFVFAGGLLATLTLLGKRRRVPHPALLAAFAFASSRLFLERVVILRTLTLAVTLFFLLLLALLERRTLLALAIAVIYPLAYTAIQVPLALLLVVAVALRIKGEMVGWRPALAVLVGTLIGIALHPDFPRNVTLAWDQNAQVLAHAWTSSRLGLEQASEFRAFPAGYVVWTSAPLVLGLAALAMLVRLGDRSRPAWEGIALGGAIVLIAALARGLGIGIETPSTRLALAVGFPLWVGIGVMLLRSLRRESLFAADTVVLLVLVGGACAGAALSARFFEYLAPLVAGALGVVLRDVGGVARARLGEVVSSRGRRVGVAVVLLALLVPVGDSLRTVGWLARGGAGSRYGSSAGFLSRNARPGEVVYHARWDAFPELFFFAPGQRYLVALDPAFLWLADPDHARYDLWEGVQRGQLSPREVRRFGARFIVTDASLERFRALGERLVAEAREGRAVLRHATADGVQVWELLEAR